MNPAEQESIMENKEEAPPQEQQESRKPDNVEVLKNLIGKSVTEDESKTVFATYDNDNDSVLQRSDLHRLLLDLANAMDFPPCVPNESVDKVLTELVLNVESTGTVSWIEFKSFFVYLQQSPLEHLFDVMTSVFSSKDLSNSILVRFAIAREEPSQHSKQQNDQQAQQGDGGGDGALPEPSAPPEEPEQENMPDLVAIKEVISAEFAEEGSVNRVFVVHHPQTSIIEALVILETPAAVTHALEKDGTPILQSPSCEVRKYENQRFPSIPKSGKHRRTASVLAEGYLYGEKAVSKMKNVDDKYEISKTVTESAQAAAAGVKSAAKSVDETLKIRETASHISTVVMDSAKDFDSKHQVSKTVTDTASQIDDKLKISENVGKAKQGLKSAATTIASNQSVISGWGYVSGFASSVSNSVFGLKQETMDIVKEKKVDTSLQDSNRALHEGATPQEDPADPGVVVIEEQKDASP